MQKTKLTLRLDADLIAYAKKEAKARGTSVSQLVADYFTLIARVKGDEPKENEESKDLPPITRSLGTEPRKEVTEEDYYRYLEEKHLK